MIQRNQSAAFSSGKVRPNHETNINIIARRTGKDVNSHTVLDGIITTIMATIQRINIIGSREGSRNRRRLKANQTGKKFRDRKSGSAGMPRPISYAVFCLKKKKNNTHTSDDNTQTHYSPHLHIQPPLPSPRASRHSPSFFFLINRQPPRSTLFPYTTLFRSLDGIITTIMATIQRINIIGSREGSRNRRRLKANQTGKKFRVGIKSNISTNRNNLISGVDRCIHLNAMKKTTITSINRQTIKI